MILNRILECQPNGAVRKLSDTQEEFEFLEDLIEGQKPPYPERRHHYLIQTSFRYPLPVLPQFQARFRPPFYHRNCFYGAEDYRTSAYEYAYHFLRQRLHVAGLSQEAQPRTHFTVTFEDARLYDLRRDTRCAGIMDRRDYGPSHEFVRSHSDLSSILYPSCRDPEQGACIVTFEIATLGLQPLGERTLHFVYQAAKKSCSIEEALQSQARLEIAWEELA